MSDHLVWIKSGYVGEATILTLWNKRSKIHFVRSSGVVIDLDRSNRSKTCPIEAKTHSSAAGEKV